MGIFVLLFAPFRFVHIFLGFTFTDIEDFIPVLSLICGLVAVAIMCRRNRLAKAASPVLLALLYILSLWSLLPNVALLFLAREHQAQRGNWPIVLINDPKNAYGLSPLYDGLFHLVAYFEAFSGAWMVIFGALFATVYPRLSMWQRRFTIGLNCFAFLLVVIDPGNLYAWWWD